MQRFLARIRLCLLARKATTLAGGPCPLATGAASLLSGNRPCSGGIRRRRINTGHFRPPCSTAQRAGGPRRPESGCCSYFQRGTFTNTCAGSAGPPLAPRLTGIKNRSGWSFRKFHPRGRLPVAHSRKEPRSNAGLSGQLTHEP